MSLSTEPTFSLLKDNFICGFKDISGKGYAGASGKHEPDQNAVDTTNGAGPHNIQMFVMTPDGTVLHCLPGYWHSQDLASELKFAQKLNAVWNDPFMTAEEKNARFKELNLRQISLEPPGMSKRSHMQGFDLQYEAKNRPHSDFFKDPSKVHAKMAKGDDNVNTVDIVMHERMAARPFVAYKKFDTANYCCYGKDEYDKHEQYRNPDGSITPGTNLSKEPMIGNDPRAHPIQTQIKRQGINALRMGLQSALH